MTKRVRHDLTKVADVDSHAFDRPTGGSLMCNLGDSGADRKLVHIASLEERRTRSIALTKTRSEYRKGPVGAKQLRRSSTDVRGRK